MIIKQVFRRGEEELCGDEFFAAVPADADLRDSLECALDMILRNVVCVYRKSFTLQLDTEKRSVEVLDVV